jgi:hypothetical protein
LKCAAIKGAGTGGYEDLIAYSAGGAALALDFTFFGLPSTYYIRREDFVGMFNGLYKLLLGELDIPQHYQPPQKRGAAASPPDVVFIEMGGDLIWATIPEFFQDAYLMSGVHTVVICSESVLSLYGALRFLEECGVHNSTEMEIVASMPLLNPETYLLRTKPIIESGQLAALFDVNKPATFSNDEEARRTYAVHHRDILSSGDVASGITRRTRITATANSIGLASV